MCADSIVRKFYDALEEGTILGTKCGECGAYNFPPKTACTECGSRSVEFVELSGKGELQFYSSGNLPPLRFAEYAPYAYGLVKMEEGPMWLTMIKGVEVRDTDRMTEFLAELPCAVSAKIEEVAGTKIVTFEVA